MPTAQTRAASAKRVRLFPRTAASTSSSMAASARSSGGSGTSSRMSAAVTSPGVSLVARGSRTTHPSFPREAAARVADARSRSLTTSRICSTESAA